jgi:hypothetical protein
MAERMVRQPGGINQPPRKIARGPTGIAEQPLPMPAPIAHVPPPIDQGGVSPFMISSLPAQASGADVYARQFYRGSKVPYRRYLPLAGV